MATVDLIGVSKQYAEQTILNDIHLNIEKGEFIAIVGPSGSGKSTLLRLVAGLDTLSKGDILINDQCVNKIPAHRRDMAMVFQSYALYPHMSVYANMAYGLKMRGMKKQEIVKRVTEVAQLLQLDDLLSRKPMSLSGGQRQRVAMGRAIVRSPAVFLFDEPLSNLDAKLRADMRHEIKKLHQTLKTTCIYVTHDQVEAMTLASRIVIMNHGRIEQVGSPQEVYRFPASIFVASFIGHYPMNFLQGKITEDAQYIDTESGVVLPIPSCLKSNPDVVDVVVGIRPEDIRFFSKPKPNTIPCKIEYIDDMGSDKLLQVITESTGTKLIVRLFDGALVENQQVFLQIQLDKAHLYNQKTGKRIGGWE